MENRDSKWLALGKGMLRTQNLEIQGVVLFTLQVVCVVQVSEIVTRPEELTLAL